MAESDQGEKTEDPTQQRREDYRKRGMVAQTKELSSFFLLLLGGIAIWSMGHFFMGQLNELFLYAIQGIPMSTSDSMPRNALLFAGQKAFFILGPLMGIAWVVAALAYVVQSGFLYNEEALSFKFERIDPVAGFQKLMSMKALVEGGKALIKLILIGTVTYYLFRAEMLTIPKLVQFSLAQIMVFIGQLTLKLMFSLAAFMLCLSAMDYLFQRWDLEKQMRMTKQEVKEEMKSREGDPLIKARIRRVQREMASRRMMDEVPKADVVITNPTHIAIVLKYTDKMVSPQIVAKGAGHMAEKIKEIARQHGVPIIENKPLARAIYKTLEIGMQIPKDLYTAVAEVLSYVYRLKKKGHR